MQALAQAQIYPEQVTLDIFTQNIFYAEGLDIAYWDTPPEFQTAPSALAEEASESASPLPVTPGGGASPGRTAYS